jgi:hypothetical protein
MFSGSSESSEMEVDHGDETMRKVMEALEKSGLSSGQALDAIREMQNSGILFRERD